MSTLDRLMLAVAFAVLAALCLTVMGVNIELWREFIRWAK